MGLAAPYTEQFAAMVRPEGGGGNYGYRLNITANSGGSAYGIQLAELTFTYGSGDCNEASAATR